MGKCFSALRKKEVATITLPNPQPRPLHAGNLKPALKSKPTTSKVDAQKQYRVLRIIDGDTFDCFPDVDGADTVVRVRIARANAPEIHPLRQDPLHDDHKECGCRVSAYVTSLLADKLLRLEPSLKPDKWPGRVDCEVFLPDNRNLSDILLQQGLAKEMSTHGRREPWTQTDFNHILKVLR